MNITELEKQGLIGICESDYQDGFKIAGHPVWSFSANTFDNARTFSGVMSSLVKKGLAVADDNYSDDNVCWITEEGIKALENLGITKYSNEN